MASITVQPELVLERILSLEIVRVTERAAVSSARLRGHGKDKASDQAAVDAMRRELNKLPIDGTVVIGEGEIDEAPMLFIGEKVGTKMRAEGRHRGRSARRHHALRQEHAGRDCHHRDGGCRHAAARARLLHGQDRHRPRLSRRAPSISMRRPTKTSCSLAKAKGVKPLGNYRDPARPAASCRHHRGGAQDRRRGQPDQRRRRRRRDPLRRTEDRHRHLSRHRRRTGRRAGRRGLALHRRPDADAADHRYRGIARAHAARWASRIRRRNIRSKTW